jgi:hypothetical protein
MLMRLANIEASHLRLLHDAVESGSQWALILEDDAFAPDITALARALDQHLTTWAKETQPKFVNISQSFPLSELRLRSPLSDEGPWDSSSRILRAGVPFTNTVCAIVYRRDFLIDLNREMTRIPMEPIVPIDWKLNLAIMHLAEEGLLEPADCYAIEPAPILQGSMHSPMSSETHG